MKLAIIGGGAVGLLAAFYLGREHDVTVVTRTAQQRDLLRKNGVCLMKEGQEEGVRLVKAAAFFEKHEYLKHDLWVVALKQTMLPAFFKEWRHCAKLPDMLFVQNGIGHLEEAKKYFRASAILGGVITHGAMKVDGNVVLHRGQGALTVGALGSRSDLICRLLSEDSQFPVREADDLERLLKRKLLTNLVVNPLTALYGERNGELLKRESWRENAYQLFLEGAAALDLGRDEWEQVVRVMEATAGNESSMLQDIKRGKETEVDAITGYLLKQGAKNGVDMPLTAFVHRSIAGLERRGENG
ncbi:2-dehydropantoate 2-reductase [Evansella caseinilytica]|uniref:2-dehydropantoate 2-reductase n=1 Tax=Evansella caseinilytica TaxID=1503961 RepID=A0A1H3MK10_9BACI|nr:2-dehydropantoate 2-reductase [Evansella caseinilytica]SDY76469.1 2-dehydropantoate 2-reductase [Evansella caseinilytica]